MSGSDDVGKNPDPKDAEGLSGAGKRRIDPPAGETYLPLSKAAGPMSGAEGFDAASFYADNAWAADSRQEDSDREHLSEWSNLFTPEKCAKSWRCPGHIGRW